MAPFPRSEPLVGEGFETDKREEVSDEYNTGEGLAEAVEGIDKALDVTRDAVEGVDKALDVTRDAEKDV